MNLRTGVDLIEIERVTQAITAHGDRFLGRVYTSAELAYCRGRRESLAARFAGKEAGNRPLPSWEPAPGSLSGRGAGHATPAGRGATAAGPSPS